MRLPASLLTKLCLTGAVGTVVAVVGCEKASVDTKPMVIEVDEVAEPTTVETVETIEFAKPPPSAAPILAPKPQTIPRKQPKPKQPVVRAHACGPCGMG